MSSVDKVFLKLFLDITALQKLNVESMTDNQKVLVIELLLMRRKKNFGNWSHTDLL